MADTGVETGAFSLDVVIAALRDVIAARGKEPDDITADTRLVSLGLDSLDVAEFFVRLEELSGRFVDATPPDRLERVGDLVRLRALEA